MTKWKKKASYVNKRVFSLRLFIGELLSATELLGRIFTSV
jgi:hypothetical protein